jgi:Uma2 family endonuclease
MFNDTNLSTIEFPPNPLAVLAPPKEPRRYTLNEYLRREETATELHEYYDGLILKLPMARGPHNKIAINVSTALENAFEKSELPFQVFGAQQLVYLPKLNYGLYPDVLVVTNEPIYYDNNEVLMINPILIIEVLSKSTKKYDRKEKFGEYKTLDSFQEYLLIDQKKCCVESRFREEPNLWRDTILTDIQDSIHLKSVGCSIPLAKIYKHINLI